MIYVLGDSYQVADLGCQKLRLDIANACRRQLFEISVNILIGQIRQDLWLAEYRFRPDAKLTALNQHLEPLLDTGRIRLQ